MNIKLGDLLVSTKSQISYSADQIQKIANTISKLGFLDPVVIDDNSVIVSGYGRLLAAQLLCLDEVPYKRFIELSKSAQRNGIKDCICADCETEFTARKDTRPVVCRRCASVRGGHSVLGNIRAKTKPCKNCSEPIRASKKDVFCSIACRNAKLREQRVCKFCSTEFVVLKSTISSVTNASGNFCSRNCYEKWLCKTERITGRGSLWHKVRAEAIRRQPFCAICGTMRTLHVHHIVPYRLTFDNSQSNLIPLCPKHHKTVEAMTHEIEHSGSDTRTMKVALRTILNERSLATRFVLKRIQSNDY